MKSPFVGDRATALSAAGMAAGALHRALHRDWPRLRAPLLGASLIVAAASSPAVLAQDGASAPDNAIVLPTPALPSTTYPNEGVEPEVTITETETEVITEFRVKGKLYMVKIDPQVGAPYYLFDTDGDGQLDRDDERGPDLAVPQWLLFSW